MYVYNTPNLVPGGNKVCSRRYIIHPESIHRCFVFDRFRICEILMRQNQSVKCLIVKKVDSKRVKKDEQEEL